MKIIYLMILLSVPCFARQLISIDDIETLVHDHVIGTINSEDQVKLNKVLQVLSGNFVFKDLEVVSPKFSPILCVICKGTLSALFSAVANGSEELLIETIPVLCVSLGITTLSVCRGAVELNLPIIKFIIKNTPEATPAAFCGMVLQTYADTNVCPFTDPRFEWTVELPPLPAPVPSQMSNLNASNFRVALITDAHLDPLYEAFGVGNCDEPTCCRFGQREATVYDYRYDFDYSVLDNAILNVGGKIMMNLDFAKKFQLLKKSSQNRVKRSSEPAGYWGDYRNCDTPVWAYDDVIERIASAHRDIDMVYYMGDTIDHGVWETSYEIINNMNSHFINKLMEEFGPDVPVIPIIGNHESHPINQFAPPRITKPGFDTHWLYEALVEKWGPYLTAEAKLTLRDRGDFSMVVKPGLRVISLNNNVAYKLNWWLIFDPQDSRRHLEWLVDELTEAELAGERVHILAHIPSGSADLTKTWSREYTRIINRFSSIITAEFNGHTHSDEFRIYYSLNDRNTPINMAWIIGSTTAYTHNNPNYKIGTFNGNTFELLNLENYIYNLTEANLTPHKRPHWFPLYNFQSIFNLSSLSPVDMDALVNRMATTDRQLLDIYSAFQSRLSDNRWSNCSISCTRNNLCRTVVTELWVNDKCDYLLNLFDS